MWINGIEYQLVEPGTVENTFLLGIVLGLVMAGMLVLFFQIGRKNMFKKYYRQINDESARKNVMGSVKRIADDIDAVAGQTNTLFFKNMANEFNSLIAMILKRE